MDRQSTEGMFRLWKYFVWNCGCRHMLLCILSLLKACTTPGVTEYKPWTLRDNNSGVWGGDWWWALLLRRQWVWGLPLCLHPSFAGNLKIKMKKNTPKCLVFMPVSSLPLLQRIWGNQHGEGKDNFGSQFSKFQSTTLGFLALGLR